MIPHTNSTNTQASEEQDQKMTGPTTGQPGATVEKDVSRRRWLRTTLAVSAGGAATALLPSAAQAQAQTQAQGQPVLAGMSNTATDMTYLTNTGAQGGMYVLASGGGNGVSGVGFANSASGLWGYSYRAEGVVGIAGPRGSNGVRGTSSASWASGVYGENHGGGFGVAGRSSGVAVYGDNLGDSGTAMLAENHAPTNGKAIIALGNVGLGIFAAGTRAPLQLGRASLAGAPSFGTHEVGELVLDNNGDLYLCKISGTPGTWKFVA